MDRHAATIRVAEAIRQGRLTRQPCEVCGAEPTDAHHDDYDKPLVVRWLCRRHHKLWHAEHGVTGDRESMMVRIGVTDDEWKELRKAAIDRATPVSQLLAELVRKYLKGRK